MPQARVVAQRHAHYGYGDVFNASDAEMESFGDKLELVPSETDFDGLNISANAIVMCERYEVDPLQIDGTGKTGQITENDVASYNQSRNVVVIKSDGETVVRTPAGEIDATKSAIDLAEELEIDLNDVDGTGKDGRIVQKDVLAFIGEVELDDQLED